MYNCDVGFSDVGISVVVDVEVVGFVSRGMVCGISSFPSWVTYTGTSWPDIDRTTSYSEPVSVVLMSSASAPWFSANCKTFAPAVSGDTVFWPKSPK